MKYLSKLIFFSSLLATVLLSCKKDENKVFFEGGTNPVLTASTTGTIPLSFATKDNLGIALSWTNPNYQFNTGISSQNVNYQIEIDRAGANFNSASKQTVAISNDLSKSFTQGEFNDFLLNQLVLDTSRPANIEIRVKATLANNGAVPMVSNVLKYTVVPYPIPPKVNPPASGKLYITGSATPGNWMGGGDPELVPQRFNKINSTLYELPSVALNGGGSYLLVPVYGDWGAKYGGVGANNSNNVNGDDFKADGGDLLAPPASGNYKITVDFQRGKFTVVKL